MATESNTRFTAVEGGKLAFDQEEVMSQGIERTDRVHDEKEQLHIES